MKAGLKPRDPVAGEAYHRPRALPRDLMAALDLFDECPDVTDVLGLEFCNLYKAIKRDEVETCLRVISPWARDHLLLNV
jgi:glutamine synthetase